MFLVFLGGVPGFLGDVPGVFGLFRVFRGCSRFSGCSGMFRDVPVFRCSWKYYMPYVPEEEINLMKESAISRNIPNTPQSSE